MIESSGYALLCSALLLMRDILDIFVTFVTVVSRISVTFS